MEMISGRRFLNVSVLDCNVSWVSLEQIPCCVDDSSACFLVYYEFMLWAELESAEEREYATERNLATFCETQTAGDTAECVELQDLEKPSGEFSRLMSEDNAAEPATPSYRRQIKALLKIRFLSEKRMPSLWLVRLLMPMLLIVTAALWWVPVGLIRFDRFQLKAGYYVNDTHDNQSAVNPGLALLSSSPAGLYSVVSSFLTVCKLMRYYHTSQHDLRPFHFHFLGKLFTHTCLFHQAVSFARGCHMTGDKLWTSRFHNFWSWNLEQFTWLSKRFGTLHRHL